MRFLFIPLAMLLASAVNAADVHRIVLHLDEADPERQNLVLNNASNINTTTWTRARKPRSRSSRTARA